MNENKQNEAVKVISLETKAAHGEVAAVVEVLGQRLNYNRERILALNSVDEIDKVAFNTIVFRVGAENIVTSILVPLAITKLKLTKNLTPYNVTREDLDEVLRGWSNYAITQGIDKKTAASHNTRVRQQFDNMRLDCARADKLLELAKGNADLQKAAKTSVVRTGVDSYADVVRKLGNINLDETDKLKKVVDKMEFAHVKLVKTHKAPEPKTNPRQPMTAAEAAKNDTRLLAMLSDATIAQAVTEQAGDLAKVYAGTLALIKQHDASKQAFALYFARLAAQDYTGN